MVAESWLNHYIGTKQTLYQINIIEMIRRHSKIKKYIHFSTPEVYGSTSIGNMKQIFLQLLAICDLRQICI